MIDLLLEAAAGRRGARLLGILANCLRMKQHCIMRCQHRSCRGDNIWVTNAASLTQIVVVKRRACCKTSAGQALSASAAALLDCAAAKIIARHSTRSRAMEVAQVGMSLYLKPSRPIQAAAAKNVTYPPASEHLCSLPARR